MFPRARRARNRAASAGVARPHPNPAPWRAVLTLAGDGAPDTGLQFVSFQASLDAFDVIFNRWMLNPDFPGQGSQPDRLFTDGIVTVQKAGFYFTPPHDGRFIAASLFDPPKPDPRPRQSGRILIRKRLVDPNGAPVLADLSGARFQVFDEAGTPLGEAFTTDPRGHATSPDVPVRVPLSLRATWFAGTAACRGSCWGR